MGFVREPVGVGGGVDAVEFDAEEVGVLVAGEIEEAGGEVFDEGEMVVFVEEDVGVGPVAEPVGGAGEEFAVTLFFALVVGGNVGGFGEVEFVGMGDGGEVGVAAAMGEEDVVGGKAGGVPEGEGFCDGGGSAVIEEEKEDAGLRGWRRDFAGAGKIDFVVGGEGEFTVPVGEAGLVLRDGNERVVEAEEVDAAAPRQDEAAPETAAGAAVDDFGADEAEERDGEVAKEAFEFGRHVSHGVTAAGVFFCWDASQETVSATPSWREVFGWPRRA